MLQRRWRAPSSWSSKPQRAVNDQRTFAESLSNSIVLIFSAALAVDGRATARVEGRTKALAQPRAAIAKAQVVFMLCGGVKLSRSGPCTKTQNVGVKTCVSLENRGVEKTGQKKKKKRERKVKRKSRERKLEWRRRRKR